MPAKSSVLVAWNVQEMLYFGKMGLIRRIWKRRSQGFKQEMLVLYFAIRDKKTPIAAKLLALLSLLYLLSPIDLIPDFIPFIGYLDDLIIVPLLLHLSFILLPASVVSSSRLKAQNHLNKIRIILILLGVVLVLIMAGIFFLAKDLFREIG